MVRPYAIKGCKRKREENYDRDDEKQFIEEETVGTVRKVTKTAPDEEKVMGDVTELAGIPIQPYDCKNQTRVIFIIEKASLEVAKVGKNYQLLNSEDHSNFLRRNNKSPADCRSDIAHQLLQKLSMTAVGKCEKLLHVIKNPVTQYLPINSHKIGFSFSSEKLVDIGDHVAAASDDANFVSVVGAMAHGKIGKDCVDDFISSPHPLSKPPVMIYESLVAANGEVK